MTVCIVPNLYKLKLSWADRHFRDNPSSPAIDAAQASQRCSGHPKSVHPCIPLLARRYCRGLSRMLQSSQVRPTLHTPCPLIPRRPLKDAPVIPSLSIPAYPSSPVDTAEVSQGCSGHPKSIHSCIPSPHPNLPLPSRRLLSVVVSAFPTSPAKSQG